MKWGVMILAAGEASRMGKAKMLLPFKEKTILEHIVEEVIDLVPNEIVLVTGHYHDKITEVIEHPEVRRVYNAAYQNGMSSSIQTGLDAMLQNNPGIDFLLILVADQPFLHKELMQKMIQLHSETKKGLVAASYQGVAGTPLLLSAKYFDKLYQLKGDKGARVILQDFSSDLTTVHFELGWLDIDTASDYNRFCEIVNKGNAD